MMTRRDLATSLALTGAAAALGAAEKQPTAKPTGPAASSQIVKPPHLAPGDTVGMVSPASMAFEASDVDVAQRQLEAIGFKVKLGPHVKSRYGTYAGTDEERAGDLNAMFADPEVRGIFCYTGGWGTPRVLPLLDYDAIRAHPKVLIGYSDITALINGIHGKTGLITFHGPVAASNIDPWTLAQMERVIFSTEPIGALTNPPKRDDELVDHDYRLLTIRGGVARGPVVGGNLTMIASLMGTPWELDTDGAILMIEDIHEAYYRIDRMLSQLEMGGKMANLAGVVFGYCTSCTKDMQAPSFSLEELLHNHFEPLGIPVLAGLAFGHLKKKLTLPIGLPGTLDADAGTLSFDQAAVV